MSDKPLHVQVAEAVKESRRWLRQEARINSLNAKGGGTSPRKWEDLLWEHERLSHDLAETASRLILALHAADKLKVTA